MAGGNDTNVFGVTVVDGNITGIFDDIVPEDLAADDLVIEDLLAEEEEDYWPAYLTWIQKVFAVLSIVCSYAICREVIVDLKSGRGRRSESGDNRIGSSPHLQTSIGRILLNLSISDIIFSFAVFLGEWPAPKDTLYIHHASGNERVCTFQGWLRALGYLTSPLFSVALNFFFLLLIRYRWQDARLHRLEKKMTIGIWIYAIVLSFIPIPYRAYNSDWDVCWIVPSPLDCSVEDGECTHGVMAYTLEIFYSFVHIWTCMFVSLVLMFGLFYTVKDLEDKAKRYTANSTSGSQITRGRLSAGVVTASSRYSCHSRDVEVGESPQANGLNFALPLPGPIKSNENGVDDEKILYDSGTIVFERDSETGGTVKSYPLVKAFRLHDQVTPDHEDDNSDFLGDMKQPLAPMADPSAVVGVEDRESLVGDVKESLATPNGTEKAVSNSVEKPNGQKEAFYSVEDYNPDDRDMLGDVKEPLSVTNSVKEPLNPSSRMSKKETEPHHPYNDGSSEFFGDVKEPLAAIGSPKKKVTRSFRWKNKQRQNIPRLPVKTSDDDSQFLVGDAKESLAAAEEPRSYDDGSSELLGDVKEPLAAIGSPKKKVTRSFRWKKGQQQKIPHLPVKISDDNDGEFHSYDDGSSELLGDVKEPLAALGSPKKKVTRSFRWKKGQQQKIPRLPVKESEHEDSESLGDVKASLAAAEDTKKSKKSRFWKPKGKRETPSRRSVDDSDSDDSDDSGFIMDVSSPLAVSNRSEKSEQSDKAKKSSRSKRPNRNKNDDDEMPRCSGDHEDDDSDDSGFIMDVSSPLAVSNRSEKSEQSDKAKKSSRSKRPNRNKNDDDDEMPRCSGDHEDDDSDDSGFIMDVSSPLAVSNRSEQSEKSRKSHRSRRPNRNKNDDDEMPRCSGDHEDGSDDSDFDMNFSSPLAASNNGKKSEKSKKSRSVRRRKRDQDDEMPRCSGDHEDCSDDSDFDMNFSSPLAASNDGKKSKNSGPSRRSRRPTRDQDEEMPRCVDDHEDKNSTVVNTRKNNGGHQPSASSRESSSRFSFGLSNGNFSISGTFVKSASAASAFVRSGVAAMFPKLGSRTHRKSRAVAYQGILYTLAFMSTHLLDMIASIIWRTHEIWDLHFDMIAYMIFQPALGIFNFLIFCRNRRVMSTPEGRFLRAIFTFGDRCRCPGTVSSRNISSSGMISGGMSSGQSYSQQSYTNSNNGQADSTAAVTSSVADV